MSEKTCRWCGNTKPLSEFYRHPQTSDGLLNKCKDCVRGYQKQHHKDTRPERSAYDRQREQSRERRQKKAEYQRRYRQLHPERAAAHRAVKYAVKRGALQRRPCEACGNPRAEAHHDDYSQRLTVRWLCFRCHREVAHGQVVTVTP